MLIIIVVVCCWVVTLFATYALTGYFSTRKFNRFLAKNKNQSSNYEKDVSELYRKIGLSNVDELLKDKDNLSLEVQRLTISLEIASREVSLEVTKYKQELEKYQSCFLSLSLFIVKAKEKNYDFTVLKGGVIVVPGAPHAFDINLLQFIPWNANIDLIATVLLSFRKAYDLVVQDIVPHGLKLQHALYSKVRIEGVPGLCADLDVLIFDYHQMAVYVNESLSSEYLIKSAEVFGIIKKVFLKNSADPLRVLLAKYKAHKLCDGVRKSDNYALEFCYFLENKIDAFTIAAWTYTSEQQNLDAFLKAVQISSGVITTLGSKVPRIVTLSTGEALVVGNFEDTDFTFSGIFKSCIRILLDDGVDSDLKLAIYRLLKAGAGQIEVSKLEGKRSVHAHETAPTAHLSSVEVDFIDDVSETTH